MRGQWVYLYRAVDKQGRTVDFLLSKRPDVAAAKRFFSRAAKQHGAPRVITLDGYAASHRAVDKLKTSGILPRRVQVRSCKYLNKRTAWRLQRHAVAALEKEIAQGFAVRATPSFSGQTLKRIQAGILDSEFTPPKIQREFKAAKAQFRI